MVLRLKKIWPPFAQECILPSLVEYPEVLKKKILKISSMYCRYFVIISPWKRMGPSFEHTWIPFTQGCFEPSLVEIDPVVLENELKMWKVYDKANGNGQIVINKLTWALGSGELKQITLNLISIWYPLLKNVFHWQYQRSGVPYQKLYWNITTTKNVSYFVVSH